MTAYDSRLLTPPREEEEIAPYQPVWRNLILQAAGIFGAASALVFAGQYLGIVIPESFAPAANVLLALLPPVLWLVFAYIPERGVPVPRERLLPAFAIAALATSGVIQPLLNDFYMTERWLSLGATFDRIIGYTFTVGIVQCGLIYLIFRYVVGRENVRTRVDAVAYAAAIAAGSTLVVALVDVIYGQILPDTLAPRIFANYAVMLVSGSIVGFGFVEMYLSLARALTLPLAILFAALLMGGATPLRASLINAGFTILKPEGFTGPAFSVTRPLFGLVFSAAFVVAMMFVVWFFIGNAESKERQQGSAEG
ncbi:MAG TPA: hypothetical protein PKX07_02955 [Aggregatilineales bacterium]|nr:hypothetical protein [Aggregatilineales bacterium]